MTSIRSSSADAKPAQGARPAASAPAAAPAVKAPAAAASTGDALVRSAAPAAPKTPAPTHASLNALAQMAADRPSFKNPDEYKNYVIKFAGYIKAAKNDLEVAQRALDAEKQKEADASAEFSKPLNAAKKVLDDTHALYQAPIDRINRELAQAKSDLDDAIYPGKRKAGELDAQASRMASQISELEDDISRSRSRIGSLETTISNELSRRNRAEADRSTAESEIRRLEPQAPSSYAYSDQKTRTSQAASRLSEANSRLSSANSRLGHAKDLQRAVDVLSSINSQYDSAVDSRSSYKGHLTRAQHDLDAAMATNDSAKITAAKAKYDEMLGKYNTADQKVRSLESQMSSYGASAGTIDSVLSSKRSELSQYGNAQSEYDAAASAKSSAQSSYDAEKNRLDGMESIMNALASNRDKRDDAIGVISQANARISAATGEKSQLNTTIYQLQDQLDTKTRERNNTVAEANRLRALQNPSTHPQVVAAKGRVDSLTNDLNQAQATYNEKIAAPKAKVDAEQKTYNDKMAPFRAKSADAQRAVEAANGQVKQVQDEFETLKSAIGGFKKMWWKLRYHFDVNEFWKTQGQAAQVAMNNALKGLADNNTALA